MLAPANGPRRPREHGSHPRRSVLKSWVAAQALRVRGGHVHRYRPRPHPCQGQLVSARPTRSAGSSLEEVASYVMDVVVRVGRSAMPRSTVTVSLLVEHLLGNRIPEDRGRAVHVLHHRVELLGRFEAAGVRCRYGDRRFAGRQLRSGSAGFPKPTRRAHLALDATAAYVSESPSGSLKSTT